jgi:branched-chain amino acid transport system ATP-binding protein
MAERALPRTVECAIVRGLLATCRALAESGPTILPVEQNICAAMSLADRVYIINSGLIANR